MNPKLCDGPSSSNNEDRNANLNEEINISKGAIPKTKNYLKNSQNGKKNLKLNNNFEGVTSSNYDSPSTNLCKNGFTKSIGNSILNNSIQMDKTRNEWECREPKFIESNSDFHFNESDSSSSEDDSLSDDGCIYTFKADSIPDIPELFNDLCLPLFNEPVAPRENASSPEMDFLEMDFEPEPSSDNKTETPVTLPDEESNQNDANVNIADYQQPCSSRDSNNLLTQENAVCKEGNVNFVQTNNVDKENNKKTNSKKARREIKMPWSCSVEQRTKGSNQLRIIKSDSNEDSSALLMRNQEINEKRVMIWSHEEAFVKQITQIGPSSCSATAVLNVLIALRLPVPSLEVVCNCEKPDNKSELLSYLKSKTTEGQGHREIISGLHKASNGRIYARFFSMFPERCVNIYDWLSFWIQNGAIPVATMNLQKSEHPISDSWCHQMIYGVDPHNMYLTNPLECVNSSDLWHQLVSESVLLVRKENILDKFNVGQDLRELQEYGDPGYDELNVLGQIARVIREGWRRKQENSSCITSHIKIPTTFRSGITLAIDRNSKAYPLLLECPELPLLNLNTC